MPLTAFQKEVASILAANRNPKSHVAGGTVINRENASPRYSNDLDLFHDTPEGVAVCAEADCNELLKQGFSVEWQLRQPSFYQAQAMRNDDSLKIEWCADSAFRFFPAQPDEEFGYCLHRADLATPQELQ